MQKIEQKTGGKTDSPRSRKGLGSRRPCACAFAGGLVLAMLVIAEAAAAVGAAERLEEYLEGLRSLSARFEQTTLTSPDAPVVESRGNLYLKRPGKFRWEYESPFEQVIIADGNRVWLYDVELEQVSHQSQEKALEGTPALLLAAPEPIERHFEVLPWDGGDDREWVELRPRTEDTQIVRIRIGFYGNRLDTLLMEDSFGQLTRIDFRATRRNPDLEDVLFRFDESAQRDYLRLD